MSKVLKQIISTSDIFFAESDRPWILDGANVHVSMVAFGETLGDKPVLNGNPVESINADLSSGANITQAIKIKSNMGVAFQGTIKRGSFDIEFNKALKYLMESTNPNGKPNSDVLVPYSNGMDVTRRDRCFWVIDFGEGTPFQIAAGYEKPFEYLKSNVLPARETAKQEEAKNNWWLHWCTRPEMRAALQGKERFIVTPRVSKHRLFVWMNFPTNPDCQLIVFGRSDDYFFGVLHSRAHEVWALKLGTRLETRPRYTPTTCFETFPLPEASQEQAAAIAQAAKELDELRARWLNPPEWTREVFLEFPGSSSGPWARYLHEADSNGIGTVRYPRLVPKDESCAKNLSKRTLTNLYNQRPTWLELAHRKLDEAVFASYGWNPSISDEELLAKLLELNLARAAR